MSRSNANPILLATIWRSRSPLSTSKAWRGTCHRPGDVKPDNSSKCVNGGVVLSLVPVTFNADPSCGKTVTYDAGRRYRYLDVTITLTNGGPDAADGTTFDDPVPAPVTVTNATCTPWVERFAPIRRPRWQRCFRARYRRSRAAAASTHDYRLRAGRQRRRIQNTATLTVGHRTVTSDSTGQQLLQQSTTLPVKLQSFDVH